MIDTLRILVSWKCNLKCSYCCNEQEQFRKDIHSVKLNDVPWHQYDIFCLSGGEPLLNWPKVKEVCARIPKGAKIILYTNGILLQAGITHECRDLGISAINVGLHNPTTFKNLIKWIPTDIMGLPLSIRFHAQDIYADWLTAEFPNVSFRFWKMNDCARNNEDRIVLS